ncbi:hypothetical protein SAMN00120144_0036 [Hymenobacter roseosalivarius DSM 11622]|uniref:Uncharacterized protein n=1 Tax=Hymenobacter roseosalivarius DSM 11622 TaxID=645990 RepID=A0A1W1W220_9BACT|nr:hypothetical protein [Hymenobacter roseosalivarius]SMB99144.1 hypothetical protein SAMN00120144_0036 [Hymenobacter roseosalivarius DSM 11622]
MHEASLAFFQNFYTNVSLYVVAEAAENAPQLPAVATAAPAAAEPVAAMVAPVFAPQLPSPPAVPAPPVSAPPVAVKPVAPAKLPSLAGLNLPPTPAVAAPASPAPAPPVPPVPDQPQRTAPPLTETPYSTLGSNANGLVIIVRMDPERFRRLPKNVFLNNLLKAIRLIVEDVVLINVESNLPVALSTLRQKLAAKQIIGFGKNLLDVAVYKTQLYEPVLLVNDVAYLPAAEIELLEEDTSRKKLLWQAMQRMFLS